MSFAEKLDYLLRNTYKPDGKLYTYAEIVDASEGQLTISHLSQLRRGTRDNPTYEVIQTLARVFKIDPQYFFDSAEEMPLPGQSVKNFDPDVVRIAYRAMHLDDNGREIIKSLIERLRRDEPPHKK